LGRVKPQITTLQSVAPEKPALLGAATGVNQALDRKAGLLAPRPLVVDHRFSTCAAPKNGRVNWSSGRGRFKRHQETLVATTPLAIPAELEAQMTPAVRALVLGLLARIAEHKGQPIKDDWIYIQEPEVLLGRLQVFNNWSPYMVADPNTTWLGLEYFCYETDELWNLSTEGMIRLAGEELERIGVIDAREILDGTVIRVPKTYPTYFGTYNRFDEVRAFTDRFVNLFLVGRNGMHKYNNQDHSMLTAMQAVDNIVAGKTDKADIWRVNTEMEYHELRK
jgi:hypothetical protein